MNLKTGGIYTTQDGFEIIIIDEYRAFYAVAILENECRNIQDILIKLSVEMKNNHIFGLIDKTNTAIFTAIDGYIGDINESLLKQLRQRVTEQIWYQKRRNNL